MILHLLLFLFCPFCWCHQDEHGNKNAEPDSVPVLVISVDSFRWNFADRIRHLRKETSPDVPSRLWEVIEKGAFAYDGITSVFPSTRFPSQHTLVTGLFPESHGVVSDVVYDPTLDRTADLNERNPDDDWVFGGEPIWKTLEKSRPDQQVGCYMWAGCENRVTKSVPFKRNTIWHDRVDKAIEWLKEGSPLVLVSSPDIDDIGRTDGPDSAGMDDALIRFDTDMAYLLKKLEEEKLIDRVNLVIVSGHGITKSLDEQSILPNNPPQDSLVRSKTPTMWLVEPVQGAENDTVTYFKQFEHLQVFSKKDVPEAWNYQNNQRIPPVVVLAEPGYILNVADDEQHKGLYGYSNSVSDMRGTLLGYGPAFQANSSIPASFTTVDVYRLLCILLNISPAPNNGSAASVLQAMTFLHPNYTRRLSEAASNVPWTAVIILSIILVVGIVIGIWLCYRSGECSRDRQTKQSTTRTVTVDARGPTGEKTPIMHKYESELVILELDDDGALKA